MTATRRARFDWGYWLTSLVLLVPTLWVLWWAGFLITGFDQDQPGRETIGGMGIMAGFACIPAVIASTKGHRAHRWWMYGVVIWIAAFIHSLVLRPTQVEQDRIDRRQGLVACPHCAEFIRPQARVCRFCGRDIQPVGAE